MSRSQWAKLMVLVVSALIALAVIVQNRGDVSARFLLVTVSMPLVLMLLITFILGLITGAMALALLRSGKVKMPGKNEPGK